ncbi:MAG: hypothetical protein C0408_02355, partial [Odoribacter sp.]|nr:hypothetical protein [Odoribacter sp.]
MKLLGVLLLFISGIAQAQDIKVLKITRLTTLKEGEFVVSGVSADGKSILASNGGYKGLYRIDIKLKKINIISDLPGAGYQPRFSPDGSKIYFRTDEFVNMKRYSSLSEFDVKS